MKGILLCAKKKEKKVNNYVEPEKDKDQRATAADQPLKVEIIGDSILNNPWLN